MNARTLFVAGCLVALGLGACTSKNETPSADTTTVVPADSAVINPAPPDTLAPDSTSMLPHDSAAATTGKTASKSGSKSSTAGKKTTTTAPAPSAPTEYHSGPRGGGSTAPSDSGHTYHSGKR
jgi:hypothetical protein